MLEEGEREGTALQHEGETAVADTLLQPEKDAGGSHPVPQFSGTSAKLWQRWTCPSRRRSTGEPNQSAGPPSSPSEEKPTAQEIVAHEMDEMLRAEEEYYGRTARRRLLSPEGSRRSRG